MIKNLEYRNIAGLELLWPKDKSIEKIEKAWNYFQEDEHKFFPKIIVETLCNNKRSVIQAGGHCGLYPIQYSYYFNNVFTFEPNTTNFYCLSENTKNYKNIHINNYGLGEIEKNVSFCVSRRNSGAHHVSNKLENVSIQLKNIDSLDIQDCDLIHLDLEGYELLALQGAIKTIEKSRPIIVLETTDAMERYNYKKEDILKFLEKYNYKIVKEWERDTAYAVL
jgi:FkbM family methyltransferase